MLRTVFKGCCQCRLAKERDLEGIDVSNIVSGDRRARRSAAVAAPIDYAAIDKSSSDEDDDSANEQASSSEDGSDVVGEGVALTTTSSWLIVQLQLLCPAHALSWLRQAPFLYDNSQ